MNPKKDGNVQRNSKPEAAEPLQEGDVVAMTQATLRMGRLEAMSPRLLYSVGWPNEFLVLHTFETPEDGPCVTLWPCCRKMVDRAKDNQLRCTGHPAIFFEKIDVVRMPKKGDKSTSVILPIIGDFLGFEWREGENPEFVARVLGKDAVGVTGVWAKLVKEIAEAGKII